MADTRSRREKLQAMANQSVCPHEAAVARAKLAKLAPEPEPARIPFLPPEGIVTGSYSATLTYEDIRRIFEQFINARPTYSRPTGDYSRIRTFHDFTPGSGRACSTCGLIRGVGYHNP